jgi:2-polyprenyl-6-methoxyphenol hydroxylase-like FAD-dependent oxidoreductase
VGDRRARIDAGLPRSQRTDVIFTTRLLKTELTRFAFPSIDECRAPTQELLDRHPDVRLSPYYKTAVGQNHLEPVLRDYARSLPGLTLELGRRVTALAQDDHGVSVVLATGSDGANETVAARYLVACDGAKSFVRQALDVPMEGEPALGQNVGIYFRSHGLIERSGLGAGILYWTLAPGASGVFIAIDGKEEWVLQRHLVAGELPENFDAANAVRQSLGADFPFEIITVQPWVPRQLVASTYRVGRALLAGDAAHLLSPTGGFGMNTGIGDAVDVAWKLAAVLQGWGGPNLLDSYEAERRPIAWRNAVEATDNRRHIDASAVPPTEIEDDSAAGHALRSQWAERIHKQKKHFSAVGITLGYRYDASPGCHSGRHTCST